MSIDISRPREKQKRSTSMFSGLFAGDTFAAIFNHGTIVGGEQEFYKNV